MYYIRTHSIVYDGGVRGEMVFYSQACDIYVYAYIGYGIVIIGAPVVDGFMAFIPLLFTAADASLQSFRQTFLDDVFPSL